jgi:hypothetical protein
MISSVSAQVSVHRIINIGVRELYAPDAMGTQVGVDQLKCVPHVLHILLAEVHVRAQPWHAQGVAFIRQLHAALPMR